MDHYHEVVVTLSESVMKNRVKRPVEYKSRGRHIKLAIKPRYLASKIKSHCGTLSWSHDRSFRLRHEKLREAPLAEKSRWCHIRLAIKPHYLRNHAWQLKHYYGTLSEIRVALESVVKSARSPPWRRNHVDVISGLQYKTSLSRKPCIPDEKLLSVNIMKSWLVFQNPSWKIAWSAPWRWNHNDVISGLQ